MDYLLSASTSVSVVLLSKVILFVRFFRPIYVTNVHMFNAIFASAQIQVSGCQEVIRQVFVMNFSVLRPLDVRVITSRNILLHDIRPNDVLRKIRVYKTNDETIR